MSAGGRPVGKITVSHMKPLTSRSQSELSGAITEEDFEKLFEDVPTVSIFSAREVTEHLTRIRDTLSNSTCDWEKRVEALKHIRSVLVCGALDVSDLHQQLRLLDIGLHVSVKNLRSQVVREACITIAYMSKRLGTKFDVLAESLMPSLIALLPNSARVMSSSAAVAITFIIANTHTSRLIPGIASNVTSKSNTIRSYCCQFISQLLRSWPKHCIERHLSTLQDAVKRGASDADADARKHCRRAFGAFAEHFPEQAASVLSSFDGTRQRQLLSETSSATASALEGIVARGNTRQSNRSSSAQRRASVDEAGASRSTPDLIPVAASSPLRRNNSMRAHNSNSPAPAAAVSRGPHTSTSNSHRSRPKAGVSQSQPGSRSSSPQRSTGSRLVQCPPDVAVVQRPGSSLGMRPKVAVPRVAQSQGNSRETSPDRQRFGFGGSNAVIRRQSEFEAAVADALRQRTSGRRQHADDSYGSDAASETSSVCSETSFRTGSEMSDEVGEIVTLCTSGSWTERREGLYVLQRHLRAEQRLNSVELKRITEVFTRMFHDPHSKVFAVFIDTFIDLVAVHGCDVVEWFSLCFSRFVSKAGMDVLSALQNRIARALEAMRNSFPVDHQFSCVTRYVVEQAQLPNVKVKLTLLNYTHGLVSVMPAAILTNTSDTRLAVSRFITWASEPKSPEVRKMAQSLLIALYELNSAEMSTMLSVLPKNFQDGAAKILSGVQGTRPRVVQPRSSSATRQNAAKLSMQNKYRADGNSYGGERVVNDNGSLYDDIRQATADIEQLNLLGRQFDMPRVDGANLPWLTSDNGIVVSAEDNQLDEEKLKTIVAELSSQDERHQAMMKLLSITQRSNTDDDTWDRHFKAVLLILLDLMKDEDGKVRTMVLKILKEMLQHQSERFMPYVELTILRLLEFEKDTDKEVLRATDECTTVLARVINTKLCISILNPLSDMAECPMNLAAIKIEEKVIRSASESDARAVLDRVVPTLIKCFESSDNSSVRKSSMLCLVALHDKVGGKELLPLLVSLNPSKMKLLNLYISRNQEQRDGNSEPSSPASPPPYLPTVR